MDVFSTSDRAGTAMNSFRLMSANLFTRFVDVDDFAAVLDRAAPDVLVTMEMVPEAAAVIEARFPNHVLNPDPGFNGWGIATRLTAELDPERQPWRGGRGRIHVADRWVNLAAVHITDPLVGNWVTHARKRRAEVDALFEWADGLPSHEPLLAAGDMNASPAWKVYRRMSGRWDDLVRQASEGRPARTWGPGVRWLRIDHVFGTGVRPLSASVERVRGSDHSAVVIDLEVV